MAPMSTNRVDSAGRVTESLMRFLERRACGGCGLIIMESAVVDQGIGGAGGEKYKLRLDHDEDLVELNELIHRLHSCGTLVAAQLWHPGPRERVQGHLPVSPSGPVPGFPDSRRMTAPEINVLVSRFVEAAHRAAAIGCDALEIHAAHGYLLHHFVNRITNKRGDAYGGTLRKRFRILEEISTGIKKNLPNLPLLLRISLDREDPFPEIAMAIQEAGYDAVDLRTGFSSQPETGDQQPPPPGYTIQLARELRPYLDVPLISGGRILTASQAEIAIVNEKLDAVVLGRPLLADPHWPKKSRAGEPVSLCLYDCRPSCYSKFKEGEPLRCIHFRNRE